MRSARDVHLSLNRYVSLALGDDWEVRPAAEQGMTERPFAVVEAASPSNHAADAGVHITEINRQFNIFAYPLTDADDVLAGQYQAELIAERLENLFSGGIDEGRPMLVPLYDYDSTPHTASSDQRRTVDFAKVLDLSTDVNQSPTEEHLFTVLAEVRLRWRRDRLLPSNKKKVAKTKPPRFDA